MSHIPRPLYVGAMNDALFIIDAPPRPSNDYINPNRNVRVIAKVNEELGHEAIAAYSRLFAAAPELLGLLKQARRRWIDAARAQEYWTPQEKDDLRRIDAAIVKATGGAL